MFLLYSLLLDTEEGRLTLMPEWVIKLDEIKIKISKRKIISVNDIRATDDMRFLF